VPPDRRRKAPEAVGQGETRSGAPTRYVFFNRLILFYLSNFKKKIQIPEVGVNIIETKGLKKDYALGKTTVHALRGIDLAIEKGDFLSIVGPSGSGKTTLLNVIGCIDFATEGSVKVGDREITALNEIGRAHV
jgi:ABC-type glutathione transport system ATPase component